MSNNSAEELFKINDQIQELTKRKHIIEEELGIYKPSKDEGTIAMLTKRRNEKLFQFFYLLKGSIENVDSVNFNQLLEEYKVRIKGWSFTRRGSDNIMFYGKRLESDYFYNDKYLNLPEVKEELMSGSEKWDDEDEYNPKYPIEKWDEAAKELEETAKERIREIAKDYNKEEHLFNLVSDKWKHIRFDKSREEELLAIAKNLGVERELEQISAQIHFNAKAFEELVMLDSLIYLLDSRK